MSHSCFIHSATDGHLDCFYIVATVNNAEMNIRVLMFFWISVFGSFGYIPRSGKAGSKGRYIFNFLRYLHIAFHSGCTNLHSHQQCKRVSLSTYPGQHLLFIDLLMIAIFNWVVWGFCCWILWLLYKFWILSPYQMFQQICSPILWVFFLFCWWFPLLCKTFLVWCSPICYFFLLFPVPGEVYLIKYCYELCLRYCCLCFLL